MQKGSRSAHYRWRSEDIHQQTRIWSCTYLPRRGPGEGHTYHLRCWVSCNSERAEEWSRREASITEDGRRMVEFMKLDADGVWDVAIEEFLMGDERASGCRGNPAYLSDRHFLGQFAEPAFV